MTRLEILQTLKNFQSKISKTLNLPLLRPGKISDKQQQDRGERLNTLYRMVIIDISKYKQVDDEKLNEN